MSPPKGIASPLGVELSTSSLARRDRTEVCSLSRGMMSQSLSDPLQTGVRFFRFPLSASRQPALRRTCP